MPVGYPSTLILLVGSLIANASPAFASDVVIRQTPVDRFKIARTKNFVTSKGVSDSCYALPRLDYSTGCIPRRACKLNVAKTPVSYDHGKVMKFPTEAGLGTALDLSKLEGYIRRDHTIATTQPAN